MKKDRSSDVLLSIVAPLGAATPDLSADVRRGDFSSQRWRLLRSAVASRDLDAMIRALREMRPRWHFDETKSFVMKSISDSFAERAGESEGLSSVCAQFFRGDVGVQQLDRWVCYGLMSVSYPFAVGEDVAKNDPEALATQEALHRLRVASRMKPGKLLADEEPSVSERHEIRRDFVQLANELVRSDLRVNAGDVVDFIEDHEIDVGKTGDRRSFMVSLIASTVWLYPW